MIEKSLIAHLLATNEIEDVVVDRIHLNVRPQNGLLPAIVIHRMEGMRERHLRGPAELAHPLIRIECMAYTGKAAKELADLVRLAKGAGSLALERFCGRMGGSDGHVVQAVTIVDDHDDFVPPAHADDKSVHVTCVDIMIWFREAGA